MTAVSTPLVLGHVYRDVDANAGVSAGPHLEAAADALAMALLCLDNAHRNGGSDSRAREVRELLADAVVALSRARIYQPAIRSLSLAVVMANEPRVDAELSRLHNIATRLLFQNHQHLPARLQAKPLGPEEEAQLAVVVAGLARQARIARALRHRWLLAALGMAAAGPLLGAPVVGAVAAIGTVVAGIWRGRPDDVHETG